MNRKKIVYIDMDGVIADFDKRLNELAPELYLGEGEDYDTRSKKVDEVLLANPGTFRTLDPIEGGIEGVKKLMEIYDVLFLSTPCDNVPDSLTDKRLWLKTHFGDLAKKKLTLTHRKDLSIGDYLVDDRLRNGAAEFTGEHIHFGTNQFPDWNSVLNYLV